jgi:hypothetical protein
MKGALEELVKVLKELVDEVYTAKVSSTLLVMCKTLTRKGGTGAVTGRDSRLCHSSSYPSRA